MPVSPACSRSSSGASRSSPGLWRREAWLVAAFATVLLLGLQTDVIGIHWLAFTVWAAAGLALGLPRMASDGAEDEVPPAPGEAVPRQ